MGGWMDIGFNSQIIQSILRRLGIGKGGLDG